MKNTELNEKLNFDYTTVPAVELVMEIENAAKDGSIRDTDVTKTIIKRFDFLLENKEEISDEDNWLVEIAARYLSDDAELFASAINFVYTVNAPFTYKFIRQLQTDREQWEDCVSEMKLVVLAHIKEYDHTKGKITTFFRRFIMGAIYESRNPGTRYNSSITKKAITARNELEAQGIVNPDEQAIARHINVTNPFYTDISDTQVRNALNMKHTITDIDEQLNLSDDSFNPEKSYIKKEEDERLRTACDKEQWAVKALYEIYCEYYLADAPVNTRIKSDDKDTDRKLKWQTKLPVEYLRRELFNKTGVDFSKDKIESLQRSVQDALAYHKVDRGASRRSSKSIIRTKVETYTPNTAVLNSIEDDILAVSNESQNDDFGESVDVLF